MSPDYCQICIQRWEQLSGQVAVKLTLWLAAKFTLY
jgi:hypothetical protein